MFRIVLFGFFVSVIIGAGNPILDTTKERTTLPAIAENLDPIVVGQTISDEHKKRWQLTSAKYHECGLCGEDTQAYPGD